jgi:hypothetical protein
MGARAAHLNFDSVFLHEGDEANAMSKPRVSLSLCAATVAAAKSSFEAQNRWLWAVRPHFLTCVNSVFSI